MGIGIIQADIIIIEATGLGSHMILQGLHNIHGIPVLCTLIAGIFCFVHTTVMVFDKRASTLHQASRICNICVTGILDTLVLSSFHICYRRMMMTRNGFSLHLLMSESDMYVLMYQ